MQQFIKKWLWLVLLAAGAPSGWSFALLGPLVPSNGSDAWQTGVIGYDLADANVSFSGGPNFLQDVGGPRNISEEYRRNVPVVYYTYDPTFLQFFGSNGVAAVDSAMAIMNNLTNADNEDLSQFPLDSQHVNYTAASFFLTDLKSVTLHLLVEQMGLAQPERFSWTLQDRFLPAGGVCPPDEEYLVVQRNFGETNSSQNEVSYSDYVNNILYSYYIIEDCTGPNPLAFTVPFSTDPLSSAYTSVAANTYNLAVLGIGPAESGGLQIGSFYSGLTRDDVAGIDYLLTTNNINWERVLTGPAGIAASYLEDVSTNSSVQELFPANTNSPTGFGTFNLGSLLSSATTNAPAVLTGLFPGLVVSSSQNYFILATNATVTSYYTNPPYGSPVGTAPILKVVTNYTYVPLTKYVTKFANVVTQYYSTNTTAILQTVTTGPAIGGVAGSIKTTTNNQTIVFKGLPSGSFYVLPQVGTFGTNLCPPGILYTLQTNVIYNTNVITIATTNLQTTTSNTLYSYSQSVITWYTNYTYVTYTVNCAQDANATGLYRGIGKVQFVREDYDSLVGQFFQPVTNSYTMTAITNSHAVTQQFVREVTAPEILLNAEDDVNDGAPNIKWTGPGDGTVLETDPNWDESQLVVDGPAGPGVINPQAIWTYNNTGSAFYNGSGFYNLFNLPGIYDQTSQIQAVAWASFDGSTNAPVLYPTGSSLGNLASEVLVQITPTTLPDGTNGVPYSQTFSVVSAPRLTGPFTWSASGLPSGLTLTSAGILSGTPIDQTGGSNTPLTYDITLVLTDSLSNSVQWSYPITIQ